MDRFFKIHCSQIGKIMGEIGLTEKQLATMNELKSRENTTFQKPLTKNMKLELERLTSIHYNPQLPDTCKTFLHEWYANDNEQIHSKYLDKGNEVENELIDFMADQLGFGLAEKNQVTKMDEYFIGTCDVELKDCIVDVKAPWNIKTFHEAVVNPIDKDYEWQGHGYMHLYGKSKFILFYGLMDTPAHIAYSEQDIIYSTMPDKDSWVAYTVDYSEEIIKSIKDRVEMCRAYLAEYDKLVKSRVGRVN